MSALAFLTLLPPPVSPGEAAQWQRLVSARVADGRTREAIVDEQLDRFLGVHPSDRSRDARLYRAYAEAYSREELRQLVEATLEPYFTAE